QSIHLTVAHPALHGPLADAPNDAVLPPPPAPDEPVPRRRDAPAPFSQAGLGVPAQSFPLLPRPFDGPTPAAFPPCAPGQPDVLPPGGAGFPEADRPGQSGRRYSPANGLSQTKPQRIAAVDS